MGTNGQHMFYNTRWQHLEINEDNVRAASFGYKRTRFPHAHNPERLTVAISRMNGNLGIFDMPEVDISRLAYDRAMDTIRRHAVTLTGIGNAFSWPSAEMIFAEYVSQDIASYYSGVRRSRAFIDALKAKKMLAGWKSMQRRDGEMIFLSDFWCKTNNQLLAVGVSSKFIAIYNSCRCKGFNLDEKNMYALLKSLYLSDERMSQYFSKADTGEIGAMYRMVRRTLFECARDSERL